MSLKPSASVPTVYHRGDEPMVRPSSAAALRPWSGASERGAAVAAAKAKEKSTVEALNDSLSAARSESQVLSSELSSLKHELSKIRNTPTGLQLLMHASMAATPSQVPRSAQEAALPRPQSAASQRDIAFRGSGPMAPKFAHAPPRTPDLESRKVWRQSSGRSQPQLSRPVDTPVAVLNEQQQQQFSEYLRSLGLNAPSMMHKPSANARRNAPASLARLPPPQPRAAPPSAHAIQPGTGARLAAVNPVQSQPFHMPGHPPVPKQQLRSSLVGSTASAPGTASGKHRSPLAGAHHAAASTAPRAARPRPSTPGAPARPPNMAWREQPKAPPTAPPAPPTVTFQADTTLQRKPSAGASTRRAPQAAATAETAAPAVAPQPVVPAPAPQQDTAQPPKPTSAPDAAPPVQPEQAAPPPEAPPPLPWEPPAPAPAPAPREPMRSFAETLALAKWEPPPAALQTAAQPPPPPPPPAADGDGGGGGGGSGAVSFFEGALPGEDADVALEMSRVRAAAVRRAVQLRSSHGATQLVALFRGWDADPGTPTIARGLLPREEFARRLAMMGELDAEPALVEKLLDASLAPPPPPLPSGADRVFGGDNTKRRVPMVDYAKFASLLLAPENAERVRLHDLAPNAAAVGYGRESTRWHDPLGKPQLCAPWGTSDDERWNMRRQEDHHAGRVDGLRGALHNQKASLNRDQLALAMRAMRKQHFTDEDLDALLNIADERGDGVISLDAFVASMGDFSKNTCRIVGPKQARSSGVTEALTWHGGYGERGRRASKKEMKQWLERPDVFPAGSVHANKFHGMF